ncbi:hypothetical protein FMM05_02380 [Flavobacterium zepuense]|uniref:Uncharacterized protein n=1 Tax=Flavobacterium zepuense TaxID=2593302 RepID=A0A552VAJ6_9FLAO|nr:DUF2268 domain-containing putative Zn-dependent protease [Flavobacterium zepuense]TRW27508.1 hypothetical protein FMM05_02380 [Flavobacterium zepuense]
MKLVLLSLALIVAFASCKGQSLKKPIAFTEKVSKLPDSIKADGITIYFAFKNQILAHQNGKYDSLTIINKVYKPHQALWDNCYGMIFGDENASKFNTVNGMVEWNKTLYPQNKKFLDERAAIIMALNLDSLLTTNLKKFSALVPYKPAAKMSILFTPIQGIGFGGCEADEFALELNNTDYDIKYAIEKGIPHELNHLAYEPHRKKDPLTNTALAQTIDEGFACYFTRVFFDNTITPEEAVENMTKADWDWYMQHEKEIFTKCLPYFMDESGDNPLLRNEKFKLFPDAPQSLNYWLGYRIIDFYVQKHGKDSWKDIYTMPIKEVYEKSGYKEYINTLK